MNYKELQQIAKKVGAVVDVPMLGRHDNTVFTTGELERFVAIIEKRTIERCAVAADKAYATDEEIAAIRKLGEQE